MRRQNDRNNIRKYQHEIQSNRQNVYRSKHAEKTNLNRRKMFSNIKLSLYVIQLSDFWRGLFGIIVATQGRAMLQNTPATRGHNTIFISPMTVK